MASAYARLSAASASPATETRKRLLMMTRILPSLSWMARCLPTLIILPIEPARAGLAMTIIVCDMSGESPMIST
ncbi:hypothetical protein D3C77_781070 [compost metagenome]